MTGKIEITIDGPDERWLKKTIKSTHLKDRIESLINQTLQFRYHVYIADLTLTSETAPLECNSRQEVSCDAH